MTTLETCIDTDTISSIVVWENGAAIEYSERDLARHGIGTILGIICDNYSDDCEVTLCDLNYEEIMSVTVGDIRECIAGQEA